MDRRCPRCKHDAAAVRYDFGAEKILRCSDCALLYLHPWPDLEETAAGFEAGLCPTQAVTHRIQLPLQLIHPIHRRSVPRS